MFRLGGSVGISRVLGLASMLAVALGACSSGERQEVPLPIGVAEQADTVAVTMVPFSVTIPESSKPENVLISASNQVTLNAVGVIGDANKLTNIAAFGSAAPLNIQSNASVYANVFAVSQVTLNSGTTTTVFGTARSAAKVDVQSPAKVLGGAQSYVSVKPGTFAWNVPWPNANGGDRKYNAANALPGPGVPGITIAPGAWGAVEIGDRNRLTLTSGTYFFESLNMQTSAELRIDSRGGPVIVYVRNSLIMGCPVLPATSAAGNPLVSEGTLRMGYYGTTDAQITGPFQGVLVAPRALIMMNRPNVGQHKAALFGKNVTINANNGPPLLPITFTMGDFTDGAIPPYAATDTDGDGESDPTDICPLDPTKTTVAICPCGVSEVDTDGDGLPNCVDPNDTDPTQVTPTCVGSPVGSKCSSQICPSTAAKPLTCTSAGICGNPLTDCPPVTTAGNCKLRLFDDHYYWFCSQGSTFQQAEALCKAVPGRSLVQVDGMKENTWLSRMVTANSWMGANSLDTANSWYWARGTTHSAFQFWQGTATGVAIDNRYSSWGSGQPGTGTCASMTTTGKWTAASCTTAQGFICEQIRQPSTNGPGTTDTFTQCKIFGNCPTGGTGGTGGSTGGGTGGSTGGGTGGTGGATSCVPLDSILPPTSTRQSDFTACDSCGPGHTTAEGVTCKASAACQAFGPVPTGNSQQCLYTWDTTNPPEPTCEIDQNGAIGAACSPALGTTSTSQLCTGGQVCGPYYTCAQMQVDPDINVRMPAACTSSADCSGGRACDAAHGYCIEPGVHDPCNGSTTCDTPCWASMRCGTPAKDPITNIAYKCDDQAFLNTPNCTETVVCPVTPAVQGTDPDLSLGGGDTSQTPFDPKTVFPKPDDPVVAPFPDAIPTQCGGTGQPTCDAIGVGHEWCNYNPKDADIKVKTPSISDKNATNPGDAQGKHGSSSPGGPISFDFDPNLTLSYNAQPSILGSANFVARAEASATANVGINMMGVNKAVSILDAHAIGEARRCGVTLDAAIKLLGVDFLPMLMGKANYKTYQDVTKNTASGTFKTSCEAAFTKFDTTVGKVVKAMRDAQEMIRQYNEAIAAGKRLSTQFCQQVMTGVTPPDGFPPLDCSNPALQPESVVNAFVDYYAKQAHDLNSWDFNEQTGAKIPRLGSLTGAGDDVSINVPLVSVLKAENTRKNQTLVNANFAVGPIPCNLTVDLFYEYGIDGGLSITLEPEAFLHAVKQAPAASLGKILAYVDPHAAAGIDLFVGAGFDIGIAAAKIGIAGIITLADIHVPLHAGAEIGVVGEKDDRPLNSELQTALKLPTPTSPYDVYFPEGRTNLRYKFLAGYTFGADVALTRILAGDIDARIKLKFFWFSRVYSARIAHFAGLKDQYISLVGDPGGGSIAEGGPTVDLGTVSMQVPFAMLHHVSPPSTSGTGGAGGSAGAAGAPGAAGSSGTGGYPATVAFDNSRIGKPFFQAQCEAPKPSNCPQIFATSSSYVPNAETSNYLVAYGKNGVDLHDRVKLYSALPSHGTVAGDVAAQTGTVILRGNTLINDEWGGTAIDWAGVSTQTYHQIKLNSQGANVPSIVLNTPLPSGTPPLGSYLASAPNATILPPGSYSDSVEVTSGGTLVLNGAGKYYFKNLTVRPSANLVVNHGTGSVEGAVEVVVSNTFNWFGTLVNGTGRPNAHVFGVYGTADVTLQSENGFNGTLVTPNAKLILNSKPYTGAFYGKSLEIHQDAAVTFVPCRGFAH